MYSSVSPLLCNILYFILFVIISYYLTLIPLIIIEFLSDDCPVAVYSDLACRSSFSGRGDTRRDFMVSLAWYLGCGLVFHYGVLWLNHSIFCGTGGLEDALDDAYGMIGPNANHWWDWVVCVARAGIATVN